MRPFFLAFALVAVFLLISPVSTSDSGPQGHVARDTANAKRSPRQYRRNYAPGLSTLQKRQDPRPRPSTVFAKRDDSPWRPKPSTVYAKRDGPPPPRPSPVHGKRDGPPPPRPSPVHRKRDGPPPPRPSPVHGKRDGPPPPRPSPVHGKRDGPPPPKPSPVHGKRDGPPPPRPSPVHGKRDGPPPPKPSPVHGKRDEGANHKRSLEEQNILENVDGLRWQTEDQCPAPLMSCPVPGSPHADAFECVDLLSDLDSCGGCAADDISFDCTAIPNARGVECVSGFCEVRSCTEGYTIAPSRDRCVRQ